MSERRDEIEAFMLQTFADMGWEDTPGTRLAFLKGLKAGWEEDDEYLPTDQAIEKVLYMIALTGMITMLELNQTLERIPNS